MEKKSNGKKQNQNKEKKIKKVFSLPNFRIFTFLMVFFVLGIFISSYFNLNFFNIYSWVVIILIFTSGIYYILNGNSLIKLSIIFGFSFFLGFLLFAYSNTKLSKINILYDQNIEFTAIIDSYPENDNSKQKFYVKTYNLEQNIRLLIETARYPEYQYGDIIKISGKIEKPKNFSDFDYINYLKRFSVSGIVRYAEIQGVGKNANNKVLSYLFSLRKHFETVVRKNLPEPESTLGIGILIGSKEGFTDELMDQFNKVGITHIIALSGFNITIIIFFLSLMLLGIVGRKINFIISIILIVLFVAMTGASSSVIRAAIISLLLVFGTTIGRRADKTNLILLAAVVMITINPFVLRFDLGFQLSFLAYLGLIYFSDIFQNIFNLRYLKKTPPIIKTAATETLSAQIVVLPLLLTTFGRVSIIAPITNILILPIIPASMLLVFLSVIIYTIIPSLGHLAFLISYLPLKYVILATKFFSALSFSAITVSKNWQISISVIYLLLLFSIILINKFKKWQTRQTQSNSIF